MASIFTELAIDCADPKALSAFWCAVLDYEVRDDRGEFITIGARPEAGADGRAAPVLTFAQVPESKTIKNRVHLDLTPRELSQEDEVRRLVDLGARHVDVGQGTAGWVVLADPEGNEFCVLSGRG